MVAVREQIFDDVARDEAFRAGDKDLHAREV